MKCINRQSVGQLSSFFPGKRDEFANSEDQEYLRMQRNGITVEPLNFPATPSILWNRTAQGESETLHLTTKRNVRLYINEKTLRLAHRHVSQTKSSFECFLVGSISVDSREDSIDVTVDRFDPGREVLVNNGSGKVKRKVPTTVVPGDHIVPISLIQGLSGADSSVTHTKDEFHKTFQVLFGRMSSQEPINLSHLMSLKVCCHSHGDDDEIIINVNCGTITMGTQIQATPVASVPIIPTALARNLSGPLRLSEVQGMPKTGYLTMDHTRKLLLLLESDPKAFSLPLLGIWVSGTYSIHHPYIWACCLRFVHSTAIQQRVFAPPNSFLLLLYSPVKTTPEFWECRRDLGQSDVMFEFYSCNENLHLEIPPGPSSSDPLCFELFPASEGMGRSLFEQAAEIWEKENKPTRLNQDGIHPHQQPAIRQGSGEEEPSPEPRPSPSPHPQNLQFVLPDVAETSLSLSFEEQVPGECSEQGYANQQVLPHPKLKQQQTKTEKKTQKQVQNDQENAQMRHQRERSPSYVKGKQIEKQFRNNGARQNSPSREPLKQILAPNQTHARVMNNKQSSQKPHPTHGSAVFQKAPIRRGSGPGHNMQERPSPKALIDRNTPRSKANGKQLYAKKPNAVHETDLKADQQKQKIAMQTMRSEPQVCKGMNGRAIPNLPNQQMISSNHQDDINRGRQVDQQHLIKPSDEQELDHNSCPLLVNPEQRPFLETVFEGETPDGTLNKSMSETEFQLQLTETSQSPQSSSILHSQRGVHNLDSESHSSGSAGLILDQGEKQSAFYHGMDKQKQYGFVQTEQNAESGDKRFSQPMVCRTEGNEEGLDNIADRTSKERLGNTVAPVSNRNEHQQVHEREWKQSEATEGHTDERSHDRIFPENNEIPADVPRPDPYELLMRQDAQLRQLQEQIKLLLQQQRPTTNPLLTPPRTPHFESFHGNNNSPVSMVTACTNTGASLLLGTPVKPRGKRSAATSPMKEKEMNHSAERRSLPASSTETSQHNTKESQKHDSTVNPEELANQVIELDDPSQTLASSLHAVDIPSFVESPSGVSSPRPTNQAKQGGMETSFTSPVLGESASILVERRQNKGDADSTGDDGAEKEESRGVKSNHVSLLQRNERQFYDNLLNQVKNILDQQGPEESSSEEPCQKDEQKEPISLHEPTREEVVTATIKELQKIQNSTLGTGNMEPPKSSFGAKQWPIHRSSSLSAIPDHPHINYMSFSVDETLDEVFNETYLKYLTDNQLQELQEMRSPHKRHSRDRAVTFSVLPEGRSALLRRGSFNTETLCDSNAISSMDYTWNNLSMATKEYLGKYCLATGQPHGSEGGSGELTAAKKVTDMSSESARSQTSVTSQGYKAPPCTPDPANKGGNDSQILDITRLKKLPKLF